MSGSKGLELHFNRYWYLNHMPGDYSPTSKVNPEPGNLKSKKVIIGGSSSPYGINSICYTSNQLFLFSDSGAPESIRISKGLFGEESDPLVIPGSEIYEIKQIEGKIFALDRKLGRLFIFNLIQFHTPLPGIQAPPYVTIELPIARFGSNVLESLDFILLNGSRIEVDKYTILFYLKNRGLFWRVSISGNNINEISDMEIEPPWQEHAEMLSKLSHLPRLGMYAAVSEEEGKIFKVEVKRNKIFLRLYLDLASKLQTDLHRNLIRYPIGLGEFDGKKDWPERLRSYYGKTAASKIRKNSFLIISSALDKKVVTVSGDKNKTLSPLVGCYSSKPSLARLGMDIPACRNITQGHDYELIFWNEGEANYYVLDAGLIYQPDLHGVVPSNIFAYET